MDQQAILSVGAAGALISGVTTAVTIWLRARTRERLAAIQGAPEEDRARLVADAIVMFEVPVDNLTKEQRYNLVVQQLVDRDRQRTRTLLFSLSLMVILSVTTVLLASRDKEIEKKATETKQTTGDKGVNIQGDNNSVTTTTTTTTNERP